MKIQQLSLFLENKPGHLQSICKTLADAGINIETLSLADTQQFGILRLIVEDWQKGKNALEQAGFVVNVTEVVATEVGFVVNVTEVVATEVEDRPGGMAEILAALEGSSINIEYMYAFSLRRGNKAVLVFRFDEPDKAIDLLGKAGKNVLGSVELFQGLS
jgi:hypothetical protein